MTPLVRREVVERWGDDVDALVDGVSARLTTDELRALNQQVAAADAGRASSPPWSAEGA